MRAKRWRGACRDVITHQAPGALGKTFALPARPQRHRGYEQQPIFSTNAVGAMIVWEPRVSEESISEISTSLSDLVPGDDSGMMRE